MPGNIIITSNNLDRSGVFNASTNPGPYNKWYVNLANLNLNGRQIGLREASIPYSYPNFVNGASITIAWPVGAGYTNFTWTIPALTNLASIAEINSSLQSFCLANGLYLIDGTGNNTFFIELLANAATYKVDLNLFLVPTLAGAGSYITPSNWPGWTNATATPKMILSAGSEMINIIGFPAGTYNGGGAQIQYSSQFVPMLQPVVAVFITCNIANNDTALNGSSTVIGTFNSKGTAYGGLIDLKVQSSIDWYDITSSSAMLEIAFYDQNWKPLVLLEPTTIINLSIK